MSQLTDPMSFLRGILSRLRAARNLCGEVPRYSCWRHYERGGVASCSHAGRRLTGNRHLIHTEVPMKTYIHLPLDRRLSLAQTAIQNTLDDPELIAYLAPYSYDEDRLQEGLELYETALDLHHRAASERGEKLGATADMHESWSTARARLRDHVALARIALRGNKGASAPLRLHEPRANTQAARSEERRVGKECRAGGWRRDGQRRVG